MPIDSEEYTREINRLRIEASSGLDAKQTELKKVERQIRTMIEAIKGDLYPPSMKAEMNTLEDRKEELVFELEHGEEPPALLHPNMALEYRKRIDGLFEALADEQTRLEARAFPASLESNSGLRIELLLIQGIRRCYHGFISGFTTSYC